MNNKDAHLIQGNSNPQINNIIKKLINDGILTENISYKNWEGYSNEIIDILREELNKIKGRKKINLIISLNDIELLGGSGYLDKIFNDEGMREIEKQNRDLFKNIYIKKHSIERAIFSVLDDTLHFRRDIMMIRSKTLISSITNLSKIEKIFEGLRREDKQKIKIISELNLNSINEELDNIIKLSKRKKGINIDISLYLKDFLKSFIGRIDIFKDIIGKEDLIEKFEERKKIKKRATSLYLLLSISIFVLIIVYNYKLFTLNKGNTENFTEFYKQFLGENIYLFSIEIILLILAFYFLGLFKSYFKIVELYDSHILLIESDYYYKNDEHFNGVNSEKLFDMRKENAQKIHSLPEKASEILNGKESNLKELSSIKILENIGKILNSLVDKLSNKK